MRGGALKRAGSVIVCALVALLPLALSAASDLETAIDDPSIELGDSTTLRVRIPGDADSVKPVKYPSVPGLRIEYAGMQRSFQYVNGKTWSGVELLFAVTGMRKGSYRIPPFIFRRGGETLQSDGVSLAVVAGGGDGAVSSVDLRTAVRLSADAAYVGEPVIMRYYLLSSGLRAAVRQINEHPDTRGFAIRQIDESPGSVSLEGDLQASHVVSFALIPAGPGSYRVGGGSATVSVEAPSRRDAEGFFGLSFPGFTTSRLIEFDTRPLAIRPLPEGGRPEGFRGDVGSFTLRAEFSDDQVRVFDEKKVTVTVAGRGNLLTMTRPEFEREVPGLKVIAEEGEVSTAIEGGALKGTRKFTYTLIPEKAGEMRPGRVRLAFFDPAGKTYRVAESKEIAFTAKGDAAARGGRFDNEGEERVSLNFLYPALIILVVAAAAVFVVVWERKRYRLAAGEGDSMKGAAVEKKTDEPDHLAAAGRCVLGRDGAGFLRAAEKSLGQIRREYGGHVPGDVEKSLGRIRDEIYACRFGGGSLSPEEMRRLHEELTALRRS